MNINKFIKSDEERLKKYLSRTMKKEQCLEWTGPVTMWGYARTTYKSKSQYIHRLIWMFSNGQIPNKKVIAHKCDNTRCINIDHLFLATQAENLMDKIKKGRCPIKSKTHCKRGHEFSISNTWITKQGRRKCKACNKVYKKEKK